jgi:hypothetical protein
VRIRRPAWFRQTISSERQAGPVGYRGGRDASE